MTVTRPQCSCQAGTHAIASRCQVLPGFSGMEFRRRPRQHLRAARPAGHLPADKRHPQTAVDPGGTFPHLPTRMRTSTSGVTSAESGGEAGPGLVRAVGPQPSGPARAQASLRSGQRLPGQLQHRTLTWPRLTAATARSSRPVPVAHPADHACPATWPTRSTENGRAAGRGRPHA